MLYSYTYAIQNKNTINVQSKEKNQLVSRAKKNAHNKPMIIKSETWLIGKLFQEEQMMFIQELHHKKWEKTLFESSFTGKP